MNYRETEDNVFIKELQSVRRRVAELESKGVASGDAKIARHITGMIVTGLLFIIGVCTFGGISCNHDDNMARVETAKACPAAASSLVASHR